MLETLAFGTAASLLATGVSAGPDTVRDLLRKEEFSREVGDLPTEFHRILRDSVRDAAENRDTDALTDIHENWDAVAQELNQLDMLFEDEEEAVERIATEIAAANNYDIDANPELERDLKEVVTETYITAITSFEERVSGTELADRLQVEADIRLVDRVNHVRNRLETLKQRLTRRRYYERFAPDEVDHIADRLADRSVEYVPRTELDNAPEAERMLIIGRAGSGKSRALAEHLPAFVDNGVTDIIVPREALTNPADLSPLENESFEGDVLLVWDDIHDLHPSENNTVFREAVQKLADILKENGNSLSVLAAARAERVDTLPGPGKPGEVEGFWADYNFETVELAPLETNTLARLFERTLEEHDVNASDEVKEAFLTRAFKTDPSPFYVVSVVSTADDTLTEDDIEALPETVLAIWEEQYTDLRTNHEETKLVLWALKLLDKFRITRYRSLVRGVYETVFGPGRHSFNTAVETLREKQWLVLRNGENILDDDAVYHVHDIQLEAVSERVENHLRAFSEFLMDDLSFYLPNVGEDSEDSERYAHSQFAFVLYEQFSERYNTIAENHFERALKIDPDSAPTHDNYAKLLKEMGRRDEAETHYKRALDIDSNFAVAHSNYANLLKELGRTDEAERHYERALDSDPDNAIIHTNYANFLKELGRTDEAERHYERALDINPDHAEAHHGYALLRKESELESEVQLPGWRNKVEHHFQQALDSDPDDAGIHNSYANFLKEVERVDDAEHHYQRALDINPDYAKAHYNYALLLAHLERREEADHHFRQALDSDPDNAIMHTYYASLLEELERVDDAEHHYQRALDIDPDYAKAHHEYALVLKELERREEADHHFQQALDSDSDNAVIHSNYANLLEELGRTDDAKRHYERALDIDPNHAAKAIVFNTQSRCSLEVKEGDWKVIVNQSEDD